MTPCPDTLCIGSALWDIIGRAAGTMMPGADRAGQIDRAPGGVALNIAVALARLGHRPALVSAVGRDAEGEELIAALTARGVICDHLHRFGGPTDRYVAIEDQGGLIAAIADARGLEAAGASILQPLTHGPLATPSAPWAGPVVIDGNLPAALLAAIADAPWLSAADLRLVSASPDKALRLAPFLCHPGATLYLNRAEAGLLAGRACATAPEAAAGLIAGGARRVLVTDGARTAADACASDLITALPPAVALARVTGAGDAFMAAHLAAELRGCHRAQALQAALAHAARHVSGETAA